MKINTRDFGQVEISEKQLLTFPNGIYAFEDAKSFALVAPREGEYPMWLQCVDDLRPCFIVFDPYLFCPDYEVSLNASEKAMLKIGDGTKIKLLCIAKVPEDFRDTTVNMKSPIVINEDEGLAMQVILPRNYPYRQPIFKRSGAEGEA